MKFKKRPVEIEALQWMGFNERPLVEFTGGRFRRLTAQQLAEQEELRSQGHNIPDFTAEIYDEIHDTWVKMKITDWVVQGVKGEFYPCDNEVLRETYEPAEDLWFQSENNTLRIDSDGSFHIGEN